MILSPTELKAIENLKRALARLPDSLKLYYVDDSLEIGKEAPVEEYSEMNREVRLVYYSDSPLRKAVKDLVGHEFWEEVPDYLRHPIEELLAEDDRNG